MKMSGIIRKIISGSKCSLHPCGPKTAIEKTSWSARFVIAPKAPHFHSGENLLKTLLNTPNKCYNIIWLIITIIFSDEVDQ